jgi:hypothetical protein
MKCTHLIRDRNVVCEALDRPYVPSLFQLAEYCGSSGYRKCPFYMKGVKCTNRMGCNVSAALSLSGM